MATHELLFVDGRPLQPVRRQASMRGFANLLRNEHGMWWDTRKWLVHLILWTLILNGLVVLVAFSLAKEPAFTAAEISSMVTTLFFLTAGQAAGFGVVVATQGAIVGEKQRGTAAWIMSKPASRPAFVLAKLVAHSAAFLLLAVVLPCAIFYAQSVILWGRPPDPVPFLGGMLVIMLHVLFYLAFSLMLGTFFRGSGSVAGIAVGALLIGLLAQGQAGNLALVLPWKLPAIGALIATQGALTRAVPLAAAAAAGWIVLLVATALWRFNREEF